MSYRKIKHEEKDYFYVIGKKFTKINGLGAFENKDIGSNVYGTNDYVVTPKHVLKIITGDNTPNDRLMVDLDEKSRTGKIRYIPFDKELINSQNQSHEKYVITETMNDWYVTQTTYCLKLKNMNISKIKDLITDTQKLAGHKILNIEDYQISIYKDADYEVKLLNDWFEYRCELYNGKNNDV